MIKVNNLTIGYREEKPLKKGFSYEFDKKIYGILGESGCGKTTFLRALAGLIKPLGGEITLDGKPLQKANKNPVYMMHQNYTSFDWLTCIDNVLLSKKIKHQSIEVEDNDRARALLSRVRLQDHCLKYPKQLSGGQRQRLALARTIFTNPEIILMDEPLSALDQSTREDMQKLLIEQHRKTGNTIILVTHSQKEAESMCDHIIKF